MKKQNLESKLIVNRYAIKMKQYHAENKQIRKNTLVFAFFCVWAFVVLCRPQDIFTFLAPVRPALILGGVIFLLFLLMNPGSSRTFFNNTQVKLYAALVFIMIIGIPFALYRRGAFEFFFTQYINVILFFFLFFRVIDSPNKLETVLFIGCVGTGLYSIFALLGGGFIKGRIFFGQVFDPNDLAFFALSFLPYNLIFLSRNHSLLKRFICVFNFGTGVLLILLTGSRGGFIGFCILIAMLLFTKTHTFKLLYKLIFIGLVLVTISQNILKIDFERYRSIADFEEDYNVTDEEGRWNVWKTGLKIMLAHPVTGVGVTCFGAAIGMDRHERGVGREYWQAAHNMFIQIGTETGVIGLALFALMSFRAFRIFGQVKKRARSEKLIKIGEMARVGFAGHLMSGMFLSQAYSIYWAFFIVLSAVLYRFIEIELEVNLRSLQAATVGSPILRKSQGTLKIG